MTEHDRRICETLALLTYASWEEGLPQPLTRLMTYQYFRFCHQASGESAATSVSDSLLDRAQALLQRTGQIASVLEMYRRQGYDVLLPQDELWPSELRVLSSAHTPHFLFVKGNTALLKSRKVSVAGSRDISPHTTSLARRIGQKAAIEGFTLVSGGARGVDTAARCGALELGGNTILIPAVPAEQLLRSAEIHADFSEGRVLLLSDALPDERFSAFKALQRNHIIYAMGDASVVVASRDGIGGSWAGAKACLRGSYSPLFVIDNQHPDMAGNRRLLSLGAQSLDPLLPLTDQILTGRKQAQTSLFDA